MMDIKLYLTPTDPWCKKAKEWLKKKKVSFEECDVEESDKFRDEMLEKSGQLAIPLIDFDGKIIIGFQEKALEEALKNAKP